MPLPIGELAEELERAEEDAEVNGNRREARGKKRAEADKKGRGDPNGINGDGGVVADADDESEKVRRTERNKKTEMLDVLVQAEADKKTGEYIPRVTEIKADEGRKDERYVWYPNLGINLNDATRDIRRDENNDEYRQKRILALEELRKRLPQIDEAVNEYRLELYWASKVLKVGRRDGNRWGSEAAALNFLRNGLKIDKNGVDKPLVVVVAEEGDKKEKIEIKEVMQGGLVVIKKEEIDKHKNDEYVDPSYWLIILGDLTGEVGGSSYRINEGEQGFSNEFRLAVMRKLIRQGFEVCVFGVQPDTKENGDIEYPADLSKVDRNEVLKMVQEMTRQNQKYDEGSLSLELKSFMDKNLDKFKMSKDLLFRDKVLIAENQTIKSEDDEKTKKKDNLVWYDGILKDLKLATFLDKDLNEGERNKRWEAVDRLRANEGITLPKMSLENDTNETKERYANREKVLGAAEFLWNPDLTTNDFWKTREDAMKFLNDCGIGVNGKPYLLEVKEEKKNKEPIWYDGIVKDLKDATDINSAEEVWKRAIDSLREHKVVFPHDTSTIDGDPGNSLRLKIFFAADFLDGKTNDRWVSKEAALKFLKNNLGVGRGGETIGNKFTIDDKRAKEEYFVGLMEIADPKKWNEMIDILKGLSAVDRDYGFGYLKVAYEWYTDPEKIKAIKGGWNLWKDTFAPILNKLGIKMDGIV